MKCLRDGDLLASHLEASESVPCLLNVVFGIEGRLTPYSKYLKWEIEKYPLKSLPWSTVEFLSLVENILKDGDISIQQKILIDSEPALRIAGYGQTFDGWGDKLGWMKKFKI